MPKARRLSDLYVTGKMIEFDDGAGTPVKVWLQKLNPVEQDRAMRQANAARSKFLALRKQPEGIEFGNLFSQVYDLGDRDQLIEYLIAPEIGKQSMVYEAELAEEEEWSKDDYLQGLRDAWEGDPDTGESLMRHYHEDEDHQQARHVFSELKRFADLVDKRLEGERERLRKDHARKTDDELRDAVLEQLIDVQADLEWMNEFKKGEIWMSTRNPDNHKERYFESRDEIDDLSVQVKSRLMDEYRLLTVDVIEGKDSEVTEASSPSPESPKPQETDESSGLKVVPA